MPVQFQKNDPRINRKGRPKKEFSLSQGLRDFMAQKDPKTKKEYRDVLVEKVLRMASAGDMAAIRLVFNYVDGSPQQMIYHKIEDEELSDEEVDKRIADALEGFDEEKELEIERRVQERVNEIACKKQKL